jgi:hypothetical protein
MMRTTSRVGSLLLVLGGACFTAGCTSGQSLSVPNIATPNVGTSSTLQFAVGTATIAAAGGVSIIGLNVVTTFRQPNGNNATGVNTPTITAPAGFRFDPLLGGTNVVTGITPGQLGILAGQFKAQPSTATTPLAAAAAKSLGPFVGAFGYGLAADNLISNIDLDNLFGLTSPLCLGVASTYVSSSTYGDDLNIGVIPNSGNNRAIPGDQIRSAELGLPIPSGEAGSPNCPSEATPGTLFSDQNFPVQYFGGPPAWPSPQGYGNFSYFVGYPLGFTDFVSAPTSGGQYPPPVAGTYSLSVAYPTSSNYSTSGTIVKTAVLPSTVVAAPLPAFAPPVLTINADGSGSISVNVPARVHEAIIDISSSDCDLAGRDLANDAVYVNHFSLVTKTTGQQTLFLSSALGPPSTVTGLPTHTFCTASDLAAYNAVAASTGGSPLATIPVFTTVAAVGFDYPAYESSYPFNTSVAPAITNGDGHTGQADVTTSYPFEVITTIAAPTAGS